MDVHTMVLGLAAATVLDVPLDRATANPWDSVVECLLPLACYMHLPSHGADAAVATFDRHINLKQRRRVQRAFDRIAHHETAASLIESLQADRRALCKGALSLDRGPFVCLDGDIDSDYAAVINEDPDRADNHSIAGIDPWRMHLTRDMLGDESDDNRAPYAGTIAVAAYEQRRHDMVAIVDEVMAARQIMSLSKAVRLLCSRATHHRAHLADVRARALYRRVVALSALYRHTVGPHGKSPPARILDAIAKGHEGVEAAAAWFGQWARASTRNVRADPTDRDALFVGWFALPTSNPQSNVDSCPLYHLSMGNAPYLLRCLAHIAPPESPVVSVCPHDCPMVLASQWAHWGDDTDAAIQMRTNMWRETMAQHTATPAFAQYARAAINDVLARYALVPAFAAEKVDLFASCLADVSIGVRVDRYARHVMPLTCMLALRFDVESDVRDAYRRLALYGSL